jgi:hypothetical protein
MLKGTMATCIYKLVYVILLIVHGYYLVMDGPNESIFFFQKKIGTNYLPIEQGGQECINPFGSH